MSPSIKKHSAFTLVEVMIVVAIVALLAAIAIPNLLRARVQAQQTSAQATLKLISNALENYAAINSVYPNTVASLTGPQPPYLSQDYFSAPSEGYSYSAVLGEYFYTVTASPLTAGNGTPTFTITTGGVIQKL